MWIKTNSPDAKPACPRSSGYRIEYKMRQIWEQSQKAILLMERGCLKKRRSERKHSKEADQHLCNTKRHAEKRSLRSIWATDTSARWNPFESRIYRRQGLITGLKRKNKSGTGQCAEVPESLITSGHTQTCMSARQVSLPLPVLRGLHALWGWRYEKEEVSKQKDERRMEKMSDWGGGKKKMLYYYRL